MEPAGSPRSLRSRTLRRSQIDASALQQRSQLLWLSNRRLAGEITADVGGGLLALARGPVHGWPAREERHGSDFLVGPAYGDDLVGAKAAGGGLQQGLGVGRAGRAGAGVAPQSARRAMRGTSNPAAN